MRTPADYSVWLTNRAREFAKDQPAVAERVRLLVIALLGMPREPVDRVTQLALEQQTHRAIQILKGWPTCEEFIRGDDAQRSA